MPEKEILTYDAYVGETIDHAASEAVSLSQRTGLEVQFKFNGVGLTASADTNPEELVQTFHDALSRKAEAYRKSPEGKAAQAKREQQIAEKTKQVDKLVDNLDATIQEGTTATMNWLAQYAPLADDISVDGRYDEVIQKLEDAGYSADDSSFDPKTTTVTANVMAKYIAGNAISTMKSGLPPHPNMTPSFVSEYKELEKSERGGSNLDSPGMG